MKLRSCKPSCCKKRSPSTAKPGKFQSSSLGAASAVRRIDPETGEVIQILPPSGRKTPPMTAVSKEEIEAAKTPAGGWTRATLEKWGVSWPPPAGWKKDLQKAYSAKIKCQQASEKDEEIEVAPEKITRAYVFSKRTKAGGWKKAQLAAWGVPWPPTKGWIERLTGEPPTNPMPEIRPQRVIWED